MYVDRKHIMSAGYLDQRLVLKDICVYVVVVAVTQVYAWNSAVKDSLTTIAKPMARAEAVRVEGDCESLA